MDNLPCSIILTRELRGGEEGGEEVIGHARLMPVAGDCTAAFIETGEMTHTLIMLEANNIIVYQFVKHT